MSRRRLIFCTAVAVVATQLVSADARGDETVVPGDVAVRPVPVPETPLAGFLHFASPFHVNTDGGSELHLPPGFYLDETKFKRLDVELRRLQENEVRLTAENKSFRESAGSWSPGWKTLLGAIVLGGATGWYIGQKY